VDEGRKGDREANIGASRVRATDESVTESLRFGAHHHRKEHLAVLSLPAKLRGEVENPSGAVLYLILPIIGFSGLS
jgi:hypothetical protein